MLEIVISFWVFDDTWNGEIFPKHSQRKVKRIPEYSNVQQIKDVIAQHLTFLLP